VLECHDVDPNAIPETPLDDFSDPAFGDTEFPL
jgi:hypothetical protein